MNNELRTMNYGKDNKTKGTNSPWSHSSVFSIHNSPPGFTLIELLVVVALIGVLTTLSLVSFSNSKRASRDAKRKADLEQIRSALEIYRSDCKTYPTAVVSGSSIVGVEADCGNTYTYMANVPTDPQSPTYNYYYVFGGLNSYSICAFLETVTPGALSGCGSCSDCNYKVTNP